MRKLIKDYEASGFKPEFIKMNDTIDAGTMHAVTGVSPDEAEGRVLIQGSHVFSDDILGDTRLYETVVKAPGEPYVYMGLCKKGDFLNRHPAAALPVFICSPYRGEGKLTTEFNERFAMAAAKMIFEKGYLPVAPHLYFPRFITDDGYGREYGIAAGHQVMRFCEKISVFVIDDYISSGMASDIEYATSQLALKPNYNRYTYERAAELIRRAEAKEG